MSPVSNFQYAVCVGELGIVLYFCAWYTCLRRLLSVEAGFALRFPLADLDAKLSRLRPFPRCLDAAGSVS